MSGNDIVEEVRRLIDSERYADFFSLEDCAKYVGCSVAQLNRLRYDGDGPPFIRLGPKSIRYSRESVKAWLLAQERRP